MHKCGKNVYIEQYKSVGDCTQFLYSPAQFTATTAYYANKPRVIHELFQTPLTYFSTRSPQGNNRGIGESFRCYSQGLLLRLLTI